MADQWVFKSETYDNCNCAVNCGCQFNLPSTYGYCQSAFVGNVVEGHFNDTPLAGLKWAGLYKWPGEIAEGNGQRQIVIDERADAAQRTALETIVSGEACAPLSNFFSVFASACTELCETLFLPIECDRLQTLWFDDVARNATRERSRDEQCPTSVRKRKTGRTWARSTSSTERGTRSWRSCQGGIDPVRGFWG